MYYMNDKPLQYLLDSVAPETKGKMTIGVPLPLKKKEEIGKQAIEKKPIDPTVLNVSTREKDIQRFDPKKVVTDIVVGKSNKELIPGIPNTYTYIGGGVLGLSLLYMLLKD